MTIVYKELINKLFQVNQFGGIKLGLKNVQYLQQILNFPDRNFESIHIAGTNGKGSVSTKIAYTLQKSGYKVGLFTSPHIASFRERIRINGEMISEKSVETLLAPLFKVIEKEQISATFFELTTFLALLYFAQEKIDVAVIETGLGGRLDATNIITPLLCIITSISLDHQEVLGNTKESIAWEKAGIIKKKIPVIIGPNVPAEPIKAMATLKNAPFIQIQENSSHYEAENRAIARKALNYIAPHFQLSNEIIQQGLEGKQPCRFEVLETNPPIVLDVAHNPNGLQSLFHMLFHYYPNRSFRLLFGLSKSKDIEGCLQVIVKFGSNFHLVEATNGRAAPVDLLSLQLEKLLTKSQSIFQHHTISEAVNVAKSEAQKTGEILVICGSFFIMKEVRQTLGIVEPCDEIDLNERQISCEFNTIKL